MDYVSLILGFIAGACGSLILWVTIGRRMMLKYAGESVINAILSPNEDTQKAIEALFYQFWRSLNSPSIEEKVTDKDGNESLIKHTPLEVIINEISKLLWIRIRGSTGAVKAEANRVESQLQTLMAGGIPLPRKGQTTGDFVLEQLANRMMPVIEQKISSWLDNKSPGSGRRDGW